MDEETKLHKMDDDMKNGMEVVEKACHESKYATGIWRIHLLPHSLPYVSVTGHVG